MDGGNKESLEERLERIRLRNQEIEKKYREAEEDRLRALKDNAMVEVKSPKHEDWPKEHKYDTLDYTYDVDPALLQEAQPSVQTPADPTGGRKKKTFTEGDGPPPDPAYNFLADSERDGSECNNNNNGDRKRNVPYGGNGGGGGDQGAGFRKSGSFRRQNSSGGGLGGGNNNNNSSNAKGKRDFVGGNAKPTAITNHNNNNNSDYHGRKPVQFEIQPKKNLETNWRSRDDPEKTSESSSTGGGGPTSPPLQQSQRQTSVEHPVIHDDTAIAATYHQQKKPLPLTTPKTQQQAIPIEKLPPALRPIVGNNNANNQQAPTALRQPMTVQEVNPGPPQQQQQSIPEKLMVEQRGNIQFSVSRDGEIQSVKLTSSSRAGTGRVGLPRAITKQSQPPPAPAQIASSVNNGNINNSLPAEAQNPNHFHIPNMAYPPPPVVSQVQVPQPHVEATSSSSNTTAKKFSVQDRLSKFQVPT